MLAKTIAWLKFLLAFALVWIILGVAVVAVMAAVTPSGTPASPFWALAILVVPVVGALLAGRWFSRKNFAAIKTGQEHFRRQGLLANQAAQDAERWRVRQFLHQNVDQHRAALQRNVRNALVKNDYGRTVSDKRTEALLEFLSSIGFTEGSLTFDEAVEEVLADLDGANQARQLEGFDPTLVPVDGHEFEHWVADSMQKFGWDTSVTSASGDQGIDVIASKNGLKLGIQCKLYSQAVGNKAIQEALAGARYHGLHRAAVLSNATFTKSAVDLAAAAEVLLISQYDLPDLDRHFFARPT